MASYTDAVYSDQAHSLRLALNLARTDDADTMKMLLAMTAGKFENSENTAYRPFWAALLWLETNPEHVRVLGGGSDRLEYESPLLSHAKLRATQGAEDSRLKLVVPIEYSAGVATQPRRFAGISR